MNPISSFLQRRREAKAIEYLKQINFPGMTGGEGYGWSPLFPRDDSITPMLWGQRYAGSAINYSQQVGDLYNNSLVMSMIRWVSKNLADARIKVVSVGKDQQEEEIEDHPLPKAFNNPNPFYGGDVLLSGIAGSWVTYATAYLIKKRNGFGQTGEIWYEPHWTIRPRWPANGSEFISYYEVKRNGQWFRLELDEVIPMYDGIDMASRRGFSGTQALLREYYADNQASHFTAVLLMHGLVPPVAIGLGDSKTPGPAGDEFKLLKKETLRLMRGDQAGAPLIFSGPVSVEKLGFDYSSVGMREIRRIPEERFCAVVGVSPQSLRLGLGQENSTYHNVQEYVRDDYLSYICTLHKKIALALEQYLLPEYPDSEGLKVCWDYSDTKVLQPNKDEEHNRIREDFRARVITLAEAREAMNYAPRPGDDEVYYPISTTTTTTQPIDIPPPQPPMPGLPPNGGPPAKSLHTDLKEGKEWWQEYAPPEARALINAADQSQGR